VSDQSKGPWLSLSIGAFAVVSVLAVFASTASAANPPATVLAGYLNALRGPLGDLETALASEGSYVQKLCAAYQTSQGQAGKHRGPIVFGELKVTYALCEEDAAKLHDAARADRTAAGRFASDAGDLGRATTPSQVSEARDQAVGTLRELLDAYHNGPAFQAELFAFAPTHRRLARYAKDVRTAMRQIATIAAKISPSFSRPAPLSAPVYFAASNRAGGADSPVGSTGHLSYVTRPKSVGLVASNPPFAEDLTAWKDWGAATTSSTGTLYYDSCVPSCASGVHRTQGSATFSQIHTCDKRRLYTELRFAYSGDSAEDYTFRFSCAGRLSSVSRG
jgi:hypothetical protein